MNACYELPFLGSTCIGDLSIQLGPVQIDPTSPSIIAIAVIAFAIGLFIFRSPVGR